ncbi:DgaE family pyridoxal phosphate-dependent ammonia lyase [Virgibacillus soli]|uniref:DgaE family pyridoxal phosphate-dependent ammonia lyase n=1 Tax=Paracerasibacillus soli TaxID=480284 RepID=A0ABU5CRT8_9BACI|nr:DgaE family pyridoxal phosphate-dependent ammonia lyase [Virgibacillus soli]MDY0409051.1 DgaE family pyridoxal phosphate-dependent ammonia lyase [Virgibacillus soli]
MSVNKLNLRYVINASGRMTKLGVSTLSDEVVSAMKHGGQHYFEMEQLHAEAGKVVAQYLHTEAAFLTNCASAAIIQSVASLITKDSQEAVHRLHDADLELNREVLIMTGHAIDYGAPIKTMIHLGGGMVKEVGNENGCTLADIEKAITDKTVAMVYVQSHYCQQNNMPKLAEVYSLLQHKEIPLIVDAAAETGFYDHRKQADLYIISGSKALKGPTSGILAGKKEFIQYVRNHQVGIGRAMKIGKEAIFGLLKAMEQYPNNERSADEQLELLQPITVLNQIEGVTVSILKDEAKRNIHRARITIGENEAKSAQDVVNLLKNGPEAIYTRDYGIAQGYFDIDPRSLQIQDIQTIVERIQHIMEG